MADIKWIKIAADVFENRKIRQIEAMPDGDSIIIIWFKILCLAGNTNDGGAVYFTKEIPYTEEMLSTEFKRPLNTVRLALQLFRQFGMIDIVENVYCISNWLKYQNIEGMDKIREQGKQRIAKFRRSKAIEACNVTSNVTFTPSNATDIDIEIDIEGDRDILLGANSSESKEEPIISLTLNNKSEFFIFQKQISEWEELYPAVDIISELRKMKGWLNSNPKKRKTKSGIRNFITTWLAKEQDKGRRSERQYEPKKLANVHNFDERVYSAEYYEKMFDGASKYANYSKEAKSE